MKVCIYCSGAIWNNWKWISGMFTLCGFCQNRATQSSGWQANQNVENGKKKNMTIKWKKKGSNFIRSWTQTVLRVGKTNWSCIKVGIELGNFAQSHTRAVWLTSQTHGVQRNRFCIKCLCRVDMPLYDSCVGYTLTKPWQTLVSFPFKNVVIREQQVWWFFFSFVSAYFIVFCCKQKKKSVLCCEKSKCNNNTCYCGSLCSIKCSYSLSFKLYCDTHYFCTFNTKRKSRHTQFLLVQQQSHHFTVKH